MQEQDVLAKASLSSVTCKKGMSGDQQGITGDHQPIVMFRKMRANIQMCAEMKVGRVGTEKF